MSYPKRLLRLAPRRGVATDEPAWSTPSEFYTLANNILFREGLAQRPESLGAVYDPPSVAPYCLLNEQIDGVNRWVYAGASSLHSVETSTHTDVTPAAGLNTVTDVNKLTLTQLNGVPVFNNGSDEPHYWDGNPANDFVQLPGWTTGESCQVIVPHRFHLFALNIDGPGGTFPDQVKWSDAAPPGTVPSTWTAAATNEAGSVELSDTPGVLVTAANLRNSLAIYKNGGTHIADYVGGNEVFEFRTLFSTSGALCRHAVADINGRHFVVVDGDIILTDGTNVIPIAQKRRRRYLFNNIDQSNFDQLFVAYNRDQNEVWLCFPEAGSTRCTRAMVWNVALDTWGDRELPDVAFAAPGIINDGAVSQVWDADSQVWDDDPAPWNEQNFSNAQRHLVFAAPGTTELLELGKGSEALTSTLGRYDLDFDEPERFKFIKRVHVRCEADAAVDIAVQVGTRNSTREPISWQPAQTLDPARGFINTLATGRFISVQLDATTDQPFRITAVDLEAELRGYH